MVKTLKLQLTIKGTEEYSEKNMREVIWNIISGVRYVQNKTITYSWEWANVSKSFYDTFEHYPNKEETQELIGKYANVKTCIYNLLKDDDLVKPLSSTVFNEAIRTAQSRYKTDLAEVIKGTKSIANFKRDLPIPLAKGTFGITLDEASGKWSVYARLLSQKWAKQNGANRGNSTVEFGAIVRDNRTRSILNRCLTGQYELCGSQLVNKDGKFYLMLSFAFDNTENNKFFEERVMGVYLGVNTAYILAFNDSEKVFGVEGNEITSFRVQMQKRRQQIMSSASTSGQGSEGKGRRKHYRAADHIGNIVANYRNTINHKYSKQIVDYALKNGCRHIRIEDLTGVSEKSKFLKEWAYYDLQTKIKYKAAVVGIDVDTVSSLKEETCEDENGKKITHKYNAFERICCICGAVHVNSDVVFECDHCGVKMSLEENVAKNLAKA